MAKRNPIPTYRHHARTGRAIVSVYHADGSRHDILLPGEFNSDESRQEYERVLATLRTNGGCLPSQGKEAKVDLSVAELILRFMTEHVAGYYVDPVTRQPTTEQIAMRQAMRPLKRLYGYLPATEFGPLNLKTVRESMISGEWMNAEEKAEREKAKQQIGLARTTVNKHVGRIKLLFRWAVEHEYVPSALLLGLQAVAGLRRGRSSARETEEVKPVPISIVESTLPHLPPVVKDMVQLLLLTGMRVGESCIMRACDIDVTGAVWLFRPEHHKNLHRGHERIIALGPKAQDIVRKYLKPKIDAYLFSPAEQDAIIAAEKRAKRKTKVQPSQVSRKKPKPRHKPGECFDHNAVNRAIRRACKRTGIPHWHTHQLRHTAALEISRQHGLEAARAVLGHKCVQMSAHYSGIDQARAAEVMKQIG